MFPSKRVPANERWFYEPVVSNALPPAAALPALVAARCALDVPEIVPVPDVSFSPAGGTSFTSGFGSALQCFMCAFSRFPGLSFHGPYLGCC